MRLVSCRVACQPHTVLSDDTADHPTSTVTVVDTTPSAPEAASNVDEEIKPSAPIDSTGAKMEAADHKTEDTTMLESQAPETERENKPEVQNEGA